MNLLHEQVLASFTDPSTFALLIGFVSVPYANEHPIRLVNKILSGFRPSAPAECPIGFKNVLFYLFIIYCAYVLLVNGKVLASRSLSSTILVCNSERYYRINKYHLIKMIIIIVIYCMKYFL